MFVIYPGPSPESSQWHSLHTGLTGEIGSKVLLQDPTQLRLPPIACMSLLQGFGPKVAVVTVVLEEELPDRQASALESLGLLQDLARSCREAPHPIFAVLCLTSALKRGSRPQNLVNAIDLSHHP